MMWGLIGFSVVVSVVVFFLAPLFITHLFDRWLESAVLFNIVEGLVRLGIFVVYLKLIGRMSDIRRVFSYHGAEHQTINAYEHGVKLDPLEVRNFSTAHTRCGTSFMLAVLVIAIFVFSLIGKPDLWLMVLSRVLLLPVIAALGYEFTRYAAGHGDNPLVSLLARPGMWLQALTTRQPELAQLEVGIAALKRALVNDNPELEGELYPQGVTSETDTDIENDVEPSTAPEEGPLT
jgi:uncharacterized protein YqhQ